MPFGLTIIDVPEAAGGIAVAAPGPTSDVVVVGAGPAGATTAIHLLQRQPRLSVTLLDRQEFPRDKSCGDGLGPGVVRVLEQLGIRDLVRGQSSPTAVRVVGPDGIIATAEGPMIGGKDLSGFVVPRHDFDAMLVKAAVDLGANLVRGTFKSTALDGSRRTVTYTADGATVDESTQVLVGADGAYSTVRKALGLPSAGDSVRHIAMRAYCRLQSPEQTPALQLEFTKALLPAYGWVFPLNDGRANIGVGLPIAILKRRKLDLNQLLDDFVVALNERGYRVTDVEGRRSHHLPHSAGMIRMAHQRAALIGDAAGTINALSGEGIYYGMRAGVELAQRLTDSANNKFAHVDANIRAFEKSYRKSLRRHFTSAYVAHRMLQYESWARLVIGAAAADPRVMEGAALMLFDDGFIRPGTTGRILAHPIRKTLGRLPSQMR
jgi:geranylgeranyl reductase family protein